MTKLVSWANTLRRKKKPTNHYKTRGLRAFLAERKLLNGGSSVTIPVAAHRWQGGVVREIIAGGAKSRLLIR